MIYPIVPFRSLFSRRLLLAGVSVLGLLVAMPPAQAAKSIQGRSGATSPAAAAVAAAQSQQAATSATSARSQALLGRALKSYKERGDAQALARAQALAGANQIIVNGALVTLGDGLYDAVNNPTGGLRPAVDTATPTGEISFSGGSTTQNPLPVSNIAEGSTVWVGADLPTQTETGGHHTVTIKQNQQKAILTWESFDIGRDTTLYFDQTKGGSDVANWIALNRVMNPDLTPSKILGNIKAEGQVYVINKNGVIFGGSSQVNVHTLVASSLNLSNAQFAAGIANPLYRFENGNDHWGLPTFGEHGTEAANTWTSVNDPAQIAPIDVSGPPPADVEVRAGALIETKSGGKAMLFAPHVINAGTIKVPDGQVILAAGENVWLTPTTRDPASQEVDTSARGLDVAVSASSPYLMSGALLKYALKWSDSGWGTFYADARNIILPAMEARANAVGYRVTNDGVIETEHGNITLQGLNITQNGTLFASTALNNQEGSIVLRAWGQGGLAFGDGEATVWGQAGTLTLGANSNTMVMPDLSDTSTIEQSSLDQRYKVGSIDLRGKIIDIESQANLVVPSGEINILASTDTRAATGSGPSYQNPTNDGSRIYIGEDALLSVAGITDVLLAMESNVVEGEFRINELRDSPLYRESWLRGATVYIDRRKSGSFSDGPMADVEWVSGEKGKWVGTALGDMTAWVNTGTTTLAELSTTGGSILLKSGGDVITRQGSLLDISGGSVTYASGWITTTKLIRADGKIVDIGDADPNEIYIGIANGTARTHSRWGVVETYASKTRGRGQGRWESGYTEGRNAGKLTILNAAGLVMEGGIAGNVITSERQVAAGNVAKAGTLTVGGNSNDERAWQFSNLIITQTPTLLEAGFTSASTLSPTFFDPAAGATSGKTSWIDADMLSEAGLGTIDLYYYNTFELAEGTTLDLAPGTKFTAAANNSNPANVTATVNGSIRAAGGSISILGGESVHLGAHARLNTAGQTVNDYSTATRVTAPVVKGGSISLLVDLGGAITVEDGAVADVSGGLWLSDRSGKQKWVIGDAGTLSLGHIANADLAQLDMRAFSAGSGGTLSLSVGVGFDVQLGGTDPEVATTLYLPGDLYAQRGFRSVTINARGDVRVPDGANVSQLPVNVDLRGVPAFTTGDVITDIGTVGVLEPELRAERKSASLDIVTLSDKSITTGTDATLATDTGGSIVLGHEDSTSRPNTVTVNGTIDAPAGSIAINGATITLSNAARLYARGVPVIYTDPITGWRKGKVQDGGSVSLNATTTMTLAQSAVIDVSGTSGVIDVADGRTTSALTLASDGGSISLKATEGIVGSILLGRAGGEGASGGKLSVAKLSGASGGGQTPYDQFINNVATVLGVDVSNLSEPLDVTALYDSFGIPAPAGMLITAEMINSLPKEVLDGNLIISDNFSAKPASAPVKGPRDFGMTDEQIDFLNGDFLAYAGSNFDAPFVAAADTSGAKSVVLSPSAINSGGFADLDITSSSKIQVDGSFVSVSRSIILNSPIISGSDANSVLSASHVFLKSLTDGSAPETLAKLTVNASLIEVESAYIRGFATTELIADNILFSGIDVMNGRDTARLDADGHLILRAGVVYPGTAVTATIRAGDKITVEQKGSGSLPLSAGGALILEAPEIVQNGTLRAQFGSITLKSTDPTSGKVTLGTGSVTSVSGAGLVLPYGTLRNDEEWIAPDATYDNSTNQSNATTAPPEKRITLDARSIEQADGALVDISGGGDLTAWEHVPGPGGSHDVLAMSGVYAILPSQATSASASGERVWLAGGNGLAAGWYTLLPAHYALLPGAYAVQVVKGTAGTALTSVAAQADGSVLMAGKAGNAYTGAADQLTSTWRVMNGSVIRSYSEYNEANANTFFSSDAFKLTQYRLTGLNVVTPRLPMDGGSVVFKATSSLIMDGLLHSAAVSGGRGGMVDIAAAKIVVAGAGTDTSDLNGYLVLDSARLSGFGAESLLLGGVRSGTSLGTAVDVLADSIVVRNDANSALSGPEIILAAHDEVTIADGSVLRAEGNIAADGGTLVITPAVAQTTDTKGTSTTVDDEIIPARDWGALIRLSNGAAVGVARTNVDSSVGGVVAIGAGAVLDGGNALMIDATRSTTLAGSAQTVARDITLGGGRIGFGGGSEGLVFDAASLARFNTAENLTLRSHTSIDFYTGLDFGSAGLKSLTLDAAGLVGRTGNAVVITGDTVTLKNSGGALTEPGVVDQSTLTLNANQLTLGSGSKALRGFTAVALNGASAIVGDGTGSLDAGAANVSLRAPIMTGRNSANQAVTTTGALVVSSSGTPPAERDTASLGSIWALSGGSLTFGGRIDAIGGKVSLTASNGNVAVVNGARIDVGGMAKSFYDVAEYVDAGSINLTAVGGDVRVNEGASLNLSAAAGGGDAGSLSAVASGGGTVVLDGAINAHSANGKGGKFTLDIAALPTFALFAQRLNDFGFSAERKFRIRSGDVVVDGTTAVEDFALVADTGKVTITGSVIAAKAYGGTIALTGGDGVDMQSGAVLKASSTTDLGGGRVTLDAGRGALNIAGGTIDVSGGEGGRVRFRADRANVVGSILNAAINGALSKVLEGAKVYTSLDGTIDSLWATAASEANAFTAGTSPINGIDVVAGIEIQSAGDLALNSDIDLSSMGGHEGGLALRAAGNLVINGNISDGFDRADRAGVLLDQASWDIRLAAGADLGSLDPLAVQPLAALAADKGSLIVGKSVTDAGGVTTTTGYLVRTGTGDLSVAAGRDLELIDGDSVLYTAGRKAFADFADFTHITRYLNGVAQAPATYGEKGGNLAIAVGGSVKTNVPSDEGQLFTEWLWRVSRADPQGYFRDYNDNGLRVGQQTTWWVEYDEFRYGVGALGGGNVRLSAGGDVNDLNVVMPTNAQMRGGRSETDTAKTLVLRNGGSMDIDVGGAILGGQYYIGRGEADITAGSLGIGRTLVVTEEQNRPTTYNPLAPILALGDAQMRVTASGDLTIQTVLDPLSVDLPFRAGFGWANNMNNDYNYSNYYYAYLNGMTDQSSLSLVSVGGDVSLERQTTYLRRGYNDGPYGYMCSNCPGYSVAGSSSGTHSYPSLTSIAALNGSINGGTVKEMGVGNTADWGGQMNIRLGANSGIQFLAAKNITGGTITMGADPLVQKDDYEPSRLYALEGSITGIRVTASEQLWIRAGVDVRQVTLRLRNLHPTDVSWIDAGNDIISGTVPGYDTTFGKYLGGGVPGEIIIQGAGSLLLTAGRDVYGQEYFIYSTGNSTYGPNNQRHELNYDVPDIAGLPSQGANIEIIAGLNGKQPDYDAFAAAYLDPASVASMPEYLTTTVNGVTLPLYLTDDYDLSRDGKQTRVGLVSFVESMTGESGLTPDQAWQKFQTLPELTQQSFLRQIYMQELRSAGRDQTGDAVVNGGYARGYTAIATLFPGDDWKGDVQIGNAFFRTMSGGDIRVMTPGGGLQVAALGTSVPNDYGLVTLGYGRIDIFTRDSVTVNRSRILTFGGGDEIIWATLGDIDAGRGAKTSRVPSAPEIKISTDGVTSIVEKADMSGSGIGTIEGYSGVEPGDLDLIAPEGTVNAGDAGVRVSGNLTLAAHYVVNTDNFDVKGEVKGLSTGETSTPTVAVETGDQGQGAASEAVRDISRQAGPRASNMPSIITVEVVGYGGGSGDEGSQQQRQREQEQQRSEGRQSYNPNGNVQVLGYSTLKDTEMAELTEAEKKAIRN